MKEIEQHNLKQSCTYFMVLAESELGRTLGGYLYQSQKPIPEKNKDWWLSRIGEELTKFRQNVEAAFPGNQEIIDRSLEHVDFVCFNEVERLTEEYLRANPI